MVLSPYNSYTVFREREREKVTLPYDVHIKWHLLETHLSLQICLFEGGRLLFNKALKALSFSLKRVLCLKVSHTCALETDVY